MKIFGNRTENSIALEIACRDIPVNLRWGGSFAPGALNGNCHYMSGLEQLTAFQRDGVPVPDFTTNKPTAYSWLRDGRTVLGRDVYHERGTDIIKAVPPTVPLGFEAKALFVKFVNSLNEWRFHIFRDREGEYKSIRRERKYNIRMTDVGLQWNVESQTEPPVGFRDAAKAACKAVGYDFGAVDMLQTEFDAPVVLEINACPMMDVPATLEAYRKAITGLV